MSDSNPVLDAIFARRSIRRYSDDKIPEDDLNTILKAAASAPTAGNLQNYSIVVIKNREKKLELFELAGKQPWMRKCDTLLLFVADVYRHKKWCEMREADFHLDNFFSIIWGSVDAVAAAQNAVIAAQGMGYGTVYIGTIFGRMQEMIETLKLPWGTYPIAMLCLGVPNETPDARERIPMEALVHWDEYQEYPDEIIDTAFEGREKAFDGTAKAKGDTKNLAQFITRRRYTSENIEGRSRSAMKALQDQGFWNEKLISEVENEDS